MTLTAKIRLIATAVLLSGIAYGADGVYVFDKVVARTTDSDDAILKLHVSVDDSAIPEDWHWTLEKEPVEKAVRAVVYKHSMESIIGHRAEVAKEIQAALAEEMKQGKVKIKEVKIVDMSFRMKTGDQ